MEELSIVVDYTSVGDIHGKISIYEVAGCLSRVKIDEVEYRGGGIYVDGVQIGSLTSNGENLGWNLGFKFKDRPRVFEVFYSDTPLPEGVEIKGISYSCPSKFPGKAFPYEDYRAVLSAMVYAWYYIAAGK